MSTLHHPDSEPTSDRLRSLSVERDHHSTSLLPMSVCPLRPHSNGGGESRNVRLIKAYLHIGENV